MIYKEKCVYFALRNFLGILKLLNKYLFLVVKMSIWRFLYLNITITTLKCHQLSILFLSNRPTNQSLSSPTNHDHQQPIIITNKLPTNHYHHKSIIISFNQPIFTYNQSVSPLNKHYHHQSIIITINQPLSPPVNNYHHQPTIITSNQSLSPLTNYSHLQPIIITTSQ